MMQYRKYLLTAVFGALLLYYGGDWLLQVVLRGPLATRQAQTARLRKQLADKERELTRIRQAGKQLDAWEEQSLPTNPEVARSLYQAWLVELVNRAGLVAPNYDSADPSPQKGLFTRFSFTVRGRGTLAQVARLLFEFYRAGHLQQIRALELAPSGKGGLLEVSLTIEALALSSVKRKDRLGTATGRRLAFARQQDYAVIARRNLFATGGSPEITDCVRLTAVTYTQGEPEAWFTIDTSGEVRKLHRGEPLDVDTLQAKIVEITDADVVFEVAGQRWLLTIGESLAKAAALPPGL